MLQRLDESIKDKFEAAENEIHVTVEANLMLMTVMTYILNGHVENFNGMLPIS